MKHTIRRQTLIVLAMLGILAMMVTMASLAGAAPATREFTPVQQGYSATGSIELPYDPTSVLVKFTTEGLQKASLNIGIE